MFPTAASALGDPFAAAIEAKVSGSDVPRATRVMAETDSSIPRAHPKTVANSPTMNVIIPMKVKATKNDGPPPMMFDGGINAKRTFHPIVKNYIIASTPLTSF